MSAVTKFPDNLSWEEGAAVWMQYLTAYGALVGLAHIHEGDYVLINAASSSVGLAAIDLVNGAGAKAIAITRGPEKVDALREAGAAHVIMSQKEDIAEMVAEYTSGEGARVVFDPVGGPGVEALCAAAAPRGIVILYGALSQEPTPLPLQAVLGKQLTVRGYVLFEITTQPDKLADARDFVFERLASGQLKPKIDRIFPFADMVAAHEYMEANDQIGKIVVKVK